MSGAVTISFHGGSRFGRDATIEAVQALLEDAGARVAAVGCGREPRLPAEHTKLIAELDEQAIAQLKIWMES